MNIEAARVHRLKNKLAIILGFCEILLGDMPADDPRRADIEWIFDAGKAALAELPSLDNHENDDASDSRPTHGGR